MLIDSHCHLDFEKYAGKGLFKDFELEKHSLEPVLDRAYRAGVTHILAIGTDLEDSLRNTQITHEKLKVFSAVGIHPDNACSHAELYGVSTTISELEKISESAISIGECGLDFHNPETSSYANKSKQIEMFEAQVDLSVRTGLPLEIHSRMAESETVSILKNNSKAQGVIHCFSGSVDFAKACLDIGFYISFSGIVTFKNAKSLREIATDFVPLDRILIETDSPFLSPAPYRGLVNEPARVVEVAKCLSEFKKIDFEQIKEITSENFFRCFNIDSGI